ncbi:MAG: hypothetical protein NVS9B5_29170 [Terriglobales bacterium]
MFDMLMEMAFSRPNLRGNIADFMGSSGALIVELVFKKEDLSGRGSKNTAIV